MGSLNFLLDTNTVIHLHKGLLQAPLPPGQMAISFITEIELRGFPGLSGEQEAWLVKFLNTIQQIGLSDEIKETTIRLRRYHRLKIPDAIIAASALVFDATLLTNDQQLLAVPGLTSQAVAIRRG